MTPPSTLELLGTQSGFTGNEGTETRLPAHSGSTLCSLSAPSSSSSAGVFPKCPAALGCLLLLPGPHTACLSPPRPPSSGLHLSPVHGFEGSHHVLCVEPAPQVLNTPKLLAFMAAENVGGGSVPSEMLPLYFLGAVTLLMTRSGPGA